MAREQITIRLPAELKDKLSQEAEKLGVSFNEMIIKLVNIGFKSFINGN